MKKTELTCIGCPMGCAVTVEMDGAGEAEGEAGILEVSVLSVCFFLLGRERQPKKKNNAAIARAIKAPLKPIPEKAVKKKSKPKTNNTIVFFIKNHLSVSLPICPERGGRHGNICMAAAHREAFNTCTAGRSYRSK